MTSPIASPAAVRTETIRGFGDARDAAETDLSRHGVALPIPQQAPWQRALGADDSVLVVARDAAGAPIGALAASILSSRALPGHHSYRVERMGGFGAADEALVAALATTIRADERCLRATMELFQPDAGAREAFAARLSAVGFARSLHPRMYRRTLALQLQGSEDEVFGRLDRSARRNIRLPGKRGLAIRPIEETTLAPRLEALTAASFRRTGAAPVQLPWEKLIELSARRPAVSRIVGIFEESATGPNALVGFAWGAVHGAYATYEAGASERRADLGNTPLGYAPLWDLISWSRNVAGVAWFDLGGVSDNGTDDARGGIADFKRYFSDVAVEVGEQWELEPHPIRGALARGVSATADRARSLLRFVRRSS